MGSNADTASPAPLPVPMAEEERQPSDVQPAASKDLEELSRRHVQFRMENNVLSDHLTRLITRKGSENFHLQLEALEEDIRETEVGSEARRTSQSSLRMPMEDGAESVGRDSRLGSLRRSSHRGSSKARPSSPPELLLPLSLEEKCEIVEDECAAVKRQIARYCDESEHILDDVQAVIEETELSIGEIRKEKKSFQREVMFEAEFRHSKYASTDRILRRKEIFIGEPVIKDKGSSRLCLVIICGLEWLRHMIHLPALPLKRDGSDYALGLWIPMTKC